MLKHLKAKHQITMKCTLCDDAGENKALETNVKTLVWASSLNTQLLVFEHTAPRTPQQRNGRVKSKIAAHCGRERAMFNHAGLNGEVGRGSVFRPKVPTHHKILTP
jgi:hypothetical protein